ncbi:MAG: acyl-CoA dehydrogenase family protein [Chloroflexi bacterium]|nr:acyl-CoA dehydrogenase family protein [Chloroflexota bacterium]MBI5350851.1 acyl-CoA dehydrogenase family protein [Chloroflexota bacterium]
MTSNLEILVQDIKTFVREELYPLEPILLQQGYYAVEAAVYEKRERVKARGWWAPSIPRHYGGLGLNLPDFARVSEVLGLSFLGHLTFNCQAPDIGNMELLMEVASDEQKERYLMPLIRGEIRSCFSMTEPEHAGSNPLYMSATAVKDGDDYVINGHKWFTSSQEGTAFAIVMAITNPDAPKLHQRASQIIVPTDTPGFRRLRNIKIMGEAGEGYFTDAEIVYENVRVPQANLLGREGEGFALAQMRLGPGRVHHCMRWIGICERAFDLMCQRAASRELSPGKLLAEKQTIQHWIAESRAEINAARFLVMDVAHKIESGGAHAARVDISLIKFYVAGVLDRLMDRAVQVHGALGITDDTMLAFAYRRERAARIYDGPDEVHKSAVARHILKEYGVNVSI